MSVRLGLSAISVAVGAAVAAIAPTDSAKAQELEEVVVTAQRREQNLQDVPIAVVSITQEQMDLMGLERGEQLDYFVPNLSIFGGGARGEGDSSNIVIRGVPGVGTYIDGVWQATAEGLLTLSTVEMERVEILRGPQGTLFGKNTMSGAIQYVTARPAEEFGARVNLTTGEFSRSDVEASVDVPVTDSLRFKFTGAQQQRDGFVQSLEADIKYGDINDQLARIDMVWEPSDNFDLRFTWDHSEIDRNGPARIVNDVVEFPSECPVGKDCIDIPLALRFRLAGLDPVNRTNTVAGFPGGQVGEYETRHNATHKGFKEDTDRFTLDINYDISDNLSFRSITGYRELFQRVYTDFSAIQYDIIERDHPRENEVFTQEFQLLGSVGDRITWVAGVYDYEIERLNRQITYWWDEFKKDPAVQAAWAAGCGDFLGLGTPCIFGGPNRNIPPGTSLGPGGGNLAPPHGGNAMPYFKDEGTAIFAEVSVALTDRAMLTVGARRNDEDIFNCNRPATDARTFISNANSPGDQLPGDQLAVGPCSAPTITDTNFTSTTPRVSFQYDFADNIMGYVSYAEGFGAGGTNLINNLAENGTGPVLILPFQPEEVESIELGLRSDLLDGRLRFNATYFAMEWLNIQAARSPQGGDCASFGVDPMLCDDIPAFITGNVGAADSDGLELETIFQASANFRVNFSVGILDTTYTELLDDPANPLAFGVEFAQAPELTYTLGLQYDQDLSNGGSLTWRGDYGYVDDYFRSADDEVQSRGKNEGYGVLNARVNYSPPTDNWVFSLFGTNLTEERWINGGFFSETIRFDVATVSRPREVGASFSFFFD